MEGMMQLKVSRYRGKPIEELTKEELIEALNVMTEYYEARLSDLRSMKQCTTPCVQASL